MVRRGRNGPIIPVSFAAWLVRKLIACNDEFPPFAPDLLRGSLFFRDRPKRHFFKPERDGEREQVKGLLDAGCTMFSFGHGKSSTAAAVRKFYGLG